MSGVRPGGPWQRGMLVEQSSVEFRWPLHPTSVRLARRFVRSVCWLWRTPDVCETAVLAVSELVGNAVRADVGDWVLLRLLWTPRRLRLEVHDESERTPTLTAADPMAESGRGLWIISQLAVRWGTTRLPRGKCVWAEFALSA